MGRRNCRGCGGRHSPPTGLRCQNIAHRDENTELDVTFNLPPPTPASDAAPTTGSPTPAWAQQLVASVQEVAQRVTQLEERQSDSSASANAPPSAAATSSSTKTAAASNDVTLDDLRQLDPLNSRVDTYLSSQASTSNLATDVLALSLGGKLLKNPRSSTVRRIRHPTLWPHQFVHRPGVAELEFDHITLPEFVAGTCVILQMVEVPQPEKAARLQHLQYLMVQARAYTWESLRSLYAAVLEDIQYGQRTWNTPIQDLKEQLLTPDQLVRGGTAATSSSGREGKKPSNSPDPCRLFNYGTCNRQPCPYQHRCYICHKYYQEINTHAAKDCTRRVVTEGAKNGQASITPKSPKT